MIILPDEIKKGANWNGSSVDHNTGQSNPNLQSSMNFAEHQRIVFAARGLIETMDFTQEQQDENPAKAALMILKAAFLNNDGGVVYISKGIHQPAADPHMQLSVVVGGETHLFHLDVSAHEVVTDTGGGNHFHWKGVRFSARVKKPKVFGEAEAFDWAFWPENVDVTPKRNRDRRNSISPQALLDLNAAIDAEKARAKAQSDKAKRENEVIDAISTKLGLTMKTPKFSKAKFFSGQAVDFTTKNGATKSCSFDGVTFTHPGGTMKV